MNFINIIDVNIDIFNVFFFLYSLLNLYLVLGTKTSLKSIVFLQMVKFLNEHKQLKAVMIRQVQDLIKLSAEWNLTKEERHNLYYECAEVLQDEGETTTLGPLLAGSVFCRGVLF